MDTKNFRWALTFTPCVTGHAVCSSFIKRIYIIAYIPETLQSAMVPIFWSCSLVMMFVSVVIYIPEATQAGAHDLIMFFSDVIWCNQGQMVWSYHRLNMEIDLQSLFGLHVHSCYHWLRTRNPPPPRIWARGRYWSMVRQDRRHIFVTPWIIFFSYFIYISGTMQPGANGLIMFSSSAVWKAAGANILRSWLTTIKHIKTCQREIGGKVNI